MFRSCVHTHTHFCDGKDSPAAIAQAAYKLGFVSLGFSGHGVASYDVVSMPLKNELQYRDEIRQLQQQYEGKMEILLGVEHDSLSAYPDFPYEYMIESIHHIPCGDVTRPIDYEAQITADTIRLYFDGDPYAYCKAYFDHCAASYERTPANIVGHIDIVSKFNEVDRQFDETDPRYLKPAKDALACAVERGLVVEMNTGAIFRGFRTIPYPSPALLKHLKDLNGQIIVTSDCHNKDFLTFHYDECAELLRSIGFTSTLRLRKNGFEEIPL